MKKTFFVTVIWILIAGIAWAFNSEVSKTVGTEGNFTTAIQSAGEWYEDADPRNGVLNISVSGTWSGTITLQRCALSNCTSPKDVDEWTSNIEASLFDPEYDIWYRLGFKTGEYTSGNATCKLSH